MKPMTFGQRVRQIVSYILFLGGVLLAVQFAYILFIEPRPRIKLPDVILRGLGIFVVLYIANKAHLPGAKKEEAIAAE